MAGYVDLQGLGLGAEPPIELDEFVFLPVLGHVTGGDEDVRGLRGERPAVEVGYENDFNHRPPLATGASGRRNEPGAAKACALTAPGLQMTALLALAGLTFGGAGFSLQARQDGAVHLERVAVDELG